VDESVRHRLLSLLGLLLILAGLLAPVTARSSLFWAAFWDGNHFIAFAAVTLLAYVGFSGGGRSQMRRVVLAGATSFAFAAAVELTQPLFSRSGSVDDLINGWLGVLAAMSGLAIWRQGVGTVWRIVHLTLCVAVFAFLMGPAVIEWRASTWRESQFPLLADFEDPRERPLWSVRKAGLQIAFVDRYPSSGMASLEVRVAAGASGGIGYDAGYQDWRPFGALSFDLYNPGDPFRLTLLVIDDSRSANFAERFTGRFQVAPGWNAFRVPIEDLRTDPPTRTLNVAAVYRLLWVVQADSRRGIEFNLDHVRLTVAP